MAFPYLEVVIGLNILTYLFETYLDVRQYAAHKLTTLPEPLIGVISQEKFEKAQAYSVDKSRFQFVRKFVAIVLDSGILYFKVLPWLWQKSGEFETYGAVNRKNEIWHTLAFLGVVMICDQCLDDCGVWLEDHKTDELPLARSCLNKLARPIPDDKAVCYATLSSSRNALASATKTDELP